VAGPVYLGKAPFEVGSLRRLWVFADATYCNKTQTHGAVPRISLM
jgi:hypothetical protein